MTALQPFLKWVGGKTQLFKHIYEEFPPGAYDYYEPFVGGGGFLTGLINAVESKTAHFQPTAIHCADINKHLIGCYTAIKNNLPALLAELKHITSFHELNLKTGSKKKFTAIPSLTECIKLGNDYIYYYFRNEFNNTTDPIRSSALFIYLNKTCFRGLCRYGPNGFNVPYGNYKNPTIFNEQQLEQWNTLLNKHNIQFQVSDFSACVTDAKNTFIYLDPPYYPVGKSFTKYADVDFDFDQHIALFSSLKALKLTQWIMSNSYSAFVKKTFALHKYFKLTGVRRAINSKNPESKTDEILILWVLDD